MITANNIIVEGQVLKLKARHNDPIPVRVDKVWKNGVFTLRYIVSGEQVSGTFSPEGSQRGDSIYYVEPLAEGETAESILAANQAARDEKAKEAADKRTEKLNAIATWWNEKGKAFWKNRQIVSQPFMGQEVSILRLSARSFEDRGESRLAFVTVTKAKKLFSDDAEEFEIHSAGLSGRNANNISGYCTSTCRGETFEEALYNLVV